MSPQLKLDPLEFLYSAIKQLFIKHRVELSVRCYTLTNYVSQALTTEEAVSSLSSRGGITPALIPDNFSTSQLCPGPFRTLYYLLELC